MQPNWGLSDQAQRARQKAKILNSYGCYFSEFGTRRRRSYMTQKIVVNELQSSPTFVGTSNVYLAMKFGVRFMGTQAHEWDSAIAVLEGMRHAPRFKMDKWVSVYGSNLGIALTDTFGTDVFLKDFDSYFARLYDGVRHDSGDPIEVGEKIIDHYRKLGIDPTSKMIVFSDGLTPSDAVKIAEHFAGSIKVSFGIGTNLTNDYANPLNIVIKLYSCDNIPVVKFSDVHSKQSGNLEALNVARWIFRSKFDMLPFQERMLFGREEVPNI
jgi:nicotinate phosphoribosyltransferase